MVGNDDDDDDDDSRVVEIIMSSSNKASLETSWGWVPTSTDENDEPKFRSAKDLPTQGSNALRYSSQTILFFSLSMCNQH